MQLKVLHSFSGLGFLLIKLHYQVNGRILEFNCRGAVRSARIVRSLAANSDMGSSVLRVTEK